MKTKKGQGFTSKGHSSARGIGPKRTPQQRLIDLEEMTRLISRGKSQSMIAQWISANRPYKLSQQQISKDWQQVMAELVAKRTTNLEIKAAEIEAQYAYVKSEATEAWEISKANAGADLFDDEGEPIVNKRGPSNEYLRTVTTVLQAEREMFGLDAPKKKPIGNENDDDRDEYMDALLPVVKLAIGQLISNQNSLTNSPGNKPQISGPTIVINKEVNNDTILVKNNNENSNANSNATNSSDADISPELLDNVSYPHIPSNTDPISDSIQDSTPTQSSFPAETNSELMDRLKSRGDSLDMTSDVDEE